EEDRAEPDGDDEHADGPAPPGGAAARAAVRERDPYRERDERDTAERGEDAGEVAPVDAVRAQVRDVEHAVDTGEDAEAEAERRPQAGPERGEGEDPGDGRDQRDRPGERVLAQAEARAAVYERVVEGVHEARGGRDGEHAGLG